MTTVLGHLLDQWTAAGAEKILVVHPQKKTAPVIAELDRLKIPFAVSILTQYMDQRAAFLR